MSLRRKSHRGKSKSTSGEYCQGFTDKHGQWNNGFFCPKWGGLSQNYCCGTDDDKYCCPKEEVQEKLHDNQAQQIGLLIGLAIGSLVLLIATTIITCYFCRCCWAYKRRKRSQANPHLPAYPGLTRDSDPVNYAMCPHGTLFPEFMVPAPPYPHEAPPPYSVDQPALPLEEKQPLPPPGVYTDDGLMMRQETDIDQLYRNDICDSPHNCERTQSHNGAVVIPHETVPKTLTDSGDSSPKDQPSTSSQTHRHRSQYQIPNFKSRSRHHKKHKRRNHYAGYDSRSFSSTDSDSYTG